ncbi:hemerythrin family protein [Geobacter sulfurreducens]|jgi:hemerythrin|uniref:Hemerythrin family protein n=1 Tax=Geobacter sulfurreducens (strain ATCC 51573 / DSM 12127 / PCA) TaxID=243231 RepID=Q748S2_GEOSL|nr:bacteriohemerythrin [Geobacter sulfurreducens]AAR36321.1 hemerythrin family protein [Geobacter sulfurreducens PCA]ADI85684.1 hemerythrin family protein [Geobacter sulfurreducens KN400]AJY69192.1 hemerythrin [Geobacter sulfurreducens]QVW34742.1 hemerythrin family protein [Geobacter sulfurreducens]UAC03610.1 bacteriohemerythrin [Geobacter sulfurreducens]
MAIGWRDDLLTGVVEVDDQHKELFRRFGELLTACNQGKGGEEVLRLFNFLDDYVVKHFAAEERIMRQHGYPDYLEHKQQHQGFTRRLEELKRQFRDEGAGLSLVITTNHVMIEWLSRHIEKMDKEIAKYVK